ncbi:uncharacterized protein LOC144103658 [Amblyomma americanum]
MHVVKIYTVVALFLFLVLEYTSLFAPLLRQIGVLGVSLVVGWWASLGIKRLLSSRHKVSPERLAVVVAGCDSEHGFVTASQLRRYGYYVLAGTQDLGGEMARGMERLKVDVVELQASNEGSVNDAYQDICERLFKEENRLHALVCNVGSGELGELEWISDRALRRVLDETVVSTARLVNRFLPLLRESRGRVVICAGPSGRVAVPGAGVYSLVNAALISYADCLRREMFKFMVQVALVEPVWINYRTPLIRMHSPGVAIKEVLSGLSRELFDDYSLRYANGFRSLWNCRTTRWYVGPTDTLATCTCRAVNDRVALPVYSCGYAEERVANEVLERLPSHFADMAQCFLYQPLAQLRAWSELGDDSGRPPAIRERIASPGFMQRLLQTTMSPKPVPFRASEMSTPTRELQTLKAEYFASSDRTEEVSPPPKTPPPLVRVRGEAFKPRRSQEHVKAGPSYTSTGPPSPSPGAEQAQAARARPSPEQAVRQARRPEPERDDDASSSDATASPEPPSDSSNTASSPKEGSGPVTPPSDEEASALLLDVMEDTQCDIVASILASVQRSVRERTNTSYSFSGTEKLVRCPATQAPPRKRPPPPGLELALSPRSPYLMGVEPLPPNFMELISPPTESERVSSPTSTTGEEHSRSPIDSANRIEVVPATPEPVRHSSLLPDATGPPRKFVAARHSEYLRRHRLSGHADPEAEIGDSDQKDSPDEPPISTTDHQDQGSLRRRQATKDPEEPPHY